MDKAEIVIWAGTWSNDQELGVSIDRLKKWMKENVPKKMLPITSLTCIDSTNTKLTVTSSKGRFICLRFITTYRAEYSLEVTVQLERQK